MISDVIALRVPEGFLLDLKRIESLLEQKMEHKDFGEYIYICLRGLVKGEHSVRYHILPSVAEKKNKV